MSKRIKKKKIGKEDNKLNLKYSQKIRKQLYPKYGKKRV